MRYLEKAFNKEERDQNIQMGKKNLGESWKMQGVEKDTKEAKNQALISDTAWESNKN